MKITFTPPQKNYPYLALKLEGDGIPAIIDPDYVLMVGKFDDEVYVNYITARFPGFKASPEMERQYTPLPPGTIVQIIQG